MKQKQSGTLLVPGIGALASFKSRIIAALNSILPADCQIKTSKDGYIMAAIFFLCITLFFYPAIVAVVYYAVKAGLHMDGGYS